MKMDITTSSQTGPHAWLQKLSGTYIGTNKVWFEPGDPVGSAEISGIISPIVDGLFLDFSYQSSFQAKPLSGRMIVGYSLAENRWMLSWLDSFHNASRIMNCESELQTDYLDNAGFSVSGSYPADESTHWGWRIEFELLASGRLRIKHFNIMPGEEGALAVVMDLQPA